jgi:hypothetical protein
MQSYDIGQSEKETTTFEKFKLGKGKPNKTTFEDCQYEKKGNTSASTGG